MITFVFHVWCLRQEWWLCVFVWLWLCADKLAGLVGSRVE